MKKQLVLIVAGVCLALGPAAFAYVQPNNSMLYQPNVNLTTLSQNTFVGTVGGIFYTPYYYNVSVNWLGYADPTGAPLVNSHLVTLWANSPFGNTGVYSNIVASAVVPAGNAAPLYNGYRWVQLPSTVTLTYQHYYVIGAQTDGVDLWGDVIHNTAADPGNNGQITWNVVNGSWSADPNSPMVQAGSGWEYTRAGRYDSASDYPMEPPNQVGTQDSIYPAPNLAYNLPIPEPASLGIAGVGAALLFGLGLKRRS